MVFLCCCLFLIYFLGVIFSLIHVAPFPLKHAFFVTQGDWMPNCSSSTFFLVCFKKEAQTHQFSWCIYVRHIYDTNTPSVSKMWWANNGNNFEFEFGMDTLGYGSKMGGLKLGKTNVRAFFVAVQWYATFLRFGCNFGHQWWIPLRRDFLLASTSTKQTKYETWEFRR